MKSRWQLRHDGEQGERQAWVAGFWLPLSCIVRLRPAIVSAGLPAPAATEKGTAHVLSPSSPDDPPQALPGRESSIRSAS
ncbi:MAG: hypothetical protein FJ026_02180 [Chloroflexi bacterium]|nr:hypothetical protein [Chloroflexota bacterium]